MQGDEKTPASTGDPALAAVSLGDEQDLVSFCRRTRSVGEQAGLDPHAVRRLSAAAYEVARSLPEHGVEHSMAELRIAAGPSIQIDFRADGSAEARNALARAIRPLHSMVHRLSVLEERDTIRVRLSVFCPAAPARLRSELHDHASATDREPSDTGSHAALLEAQRELQAELQETNRGVVALYAELDDRAQRLLGAEDDLRRRAEELAAANRAKEDFLATLSHELRTPLNAMLGWTRLLRSGRLEPAMAARALETIERNARLQEQLIADILDVSRIVTGKLRLELRRVEMAPIVEAAVDAVRPTADAKGLRLDSAGVDQFIQVRGDPDRLQQVAWNLLANAIKFTPSGGAVAVRLGREADRALMSVSDTGEGIPPDLLPFIFERFWQGDTSVTRPHGGLGVGLSIVRHIVELHGGRVTAESEGPGQGATFTVTLPAASGA
ncbi:MAG TPA: HAMP domain-containing sensor histidine kinase [Vicinamibacterales bacterium]|nr:HAMP domain-containing sensor histidine kinase [Vicinamibacterales bacterium]